MAVLVRRLAVSCNLRSHSIPRLIELQAIVVELVENFKFAPPEDEPGIIRVPTGIMSPMVKGRMGEGVQMPLHVTAL